MLPTDSLSRRLSSRFLCSSKSVTIYPFALQLSKHHQLLSAVGSFPIPLSSIILVESCEMVKISYAHFANVYIVGFIFSFVFDVILDLHLISEPLSGLGSL